MRNFSDADAFLAGRKINKTSAKIANNTLLYRLDANNIAVRLHNTNIVIYHSDGTITVDSGGWCTPTTRNRIERFSALRIHTVKGDWFAGNTGELTPPKVQKCRKCHGVGWLPQVCNDNYCYPGWGQTADGRFGHHTCEHGHNRGHYLDACKPHHKTPGHDLSPSQCWRCKTTGTVDYGSDVIRHRFDGALLIDSCGNVLDQHLPVIPNTPPPAKKSKHQSGWGSWSANVPALQYSKSPQPANTIGGDTIVAALTALCPAMDSLVCVPCGCTEDAMGHTLRQAVIHLNDSENWSRERVADWLDTLDLDINLLHAS